MGAPDDPGAANRRNWDERVEPHLRAYDVEGFLADPTLLTQTARVDLDLLRPHLPNGSVAGLGIVHLQCHLGLDTLSFARQGARVTGVDFSPAAVTAARRIAERAGLAATFVEADAHTAADVCDERFDIVYTGTGALVWLADLSAWARTVARLLEPGGVLFVRDTHPVLGALDQGRDDGLLALAEPYFGGAGPVRFDSPTTYADERVRLANAVTYQWPHSLAEIVQPLLDAGLVLTSLAEHRTLPWRALAHLVEVEDGWALPGDDLRAPLAFSLTAIRPLR